MSYYCFCFLSLDAQTGILVLHFVVDLRKFLSRLSRLVLEAQVCARRASNHRPASGASCVRTRAVGVRAVLPTRTGSAMLAVQTGGRGITSPPALDNGDDVASVAKSPMTPTQGGRASVVSPKVLDPSDLDQLGPEDRIAVMNMVKEVRCGCFAHEQALATHASVALS